MNMRPTLTNIQSEQKLLEEEVDIVNQRVTSLKSMLAKYVEVQKNGNNKTK